jgi:lipopolysaccharide transport system permease protein
MVTVIEAGERRPLPRLRELTAYRDLVYFLVRRDLAVRYAQTAVGVVWGVLQPVILAVVFSVFLGELAKVPSQGDIPYPLFAITGMVLWGFATQALQRAADSTVANAELVGKVWFPRVLIPLAAVITPLVDVAIGAVVVLVAMLFYGHSPTWEALLIPLPIALALLNTVGAGLWLSALNVRYRDVSVAVPFAVLVGLFVTPIIYPFDLVPSNLQPIYAVNPMVGVLELWRWCLFPDSFDLAWVMAVPVVIGGLLLVAGLRSFTRLEMEFADVI